MTHAERCPICHGRGKLTYQSYYGESFTSGVVSDHVCHSCNGKGWVEVNDNIIFNYSSDLQYVFPKSTPEGGI